MSPSIPLKPNKSNAPAAWKPTQISKASVRSRYSYGQAMERRPAHAQLIGLIVSSWASTEWRLAEIYAYIGNKATWRAAYEIQEHRNLQPKIALILQALKQHLGEPMELAARPLLRAASSFKKARDALAHGAFIVSDEYPDGIIRLSAWGADEKLFLYTTATLEALLGEFYQLDADMGAFWFDVNVRYRPEEYESGRWITPQPLSLEDLERLFPKGIQDNQPSPESSQRQNDGEAPHE